MVGVGQAVLGGSLPQQHRCRRTRGGSPGSERHRERGVAEADSQGIAGEYLEQNRGEILLVCGLQATQGSEVLGLPPGLLQTL